MCRSLFRKMDSSKLSNAPHGADAHRRFHVTHPFHPLFQREFDLITHRSNWGDDRVYFHDDEGCLKSLPAMWTSVTPEDPFVTLAAGRSHFRVEDLLEIAERVGRRVR